MNDNHAERLRGLSRLTSASFLDDAADEIDRLTAENARLRERLAALADAADEVGVRYFDTDTMSPEVEAMQAATIAARAALPKETT